MRNKTNILLTVILGITILITGCTFLSRPPSKTEAKFFDVETNIVQKVVLSTNVVSITNSVPMFETNQVGVIVTRTNEIVIPRYEIVQVTNQVEVYTFKPNQTTIQGAQSVGAISDIVAPGSGGIIVGILSGLAIAWGKLRSYKQTGTVLSQNIQALRELVKKMPNGAALDQQIVQYLTKHQTEAGVVGNVATLLAKYVDKGEAKDSAEEIRNALKELGITVP